MPATIVYIPHGGGPMPLLGDPAQQQLADFLQILPRRLIRPEAILVISAHWEERVPTLLDAPLPPLLYDYYGFPEESYRIQYPAPGEPLLAAAIRELLQSRGIPAALDSSRGFDHGMFVPLKLMYPAADIPCVQLSLLSSLDAADHIAMGEALCELRDRNLLILGSGMSYHNLGALFMPGGDDDRKFNQWLLDICAGPGLSYPERRQRLAHWTAAPAALECHPRPEHLLPLHVCFGSAGPGSSPAETIFHAAVMGRTVVGFLWQ